MEWQAISTAPEDKVLLMKDERGEFLGYTSWAGCMEQNIEALDARRNATHWMPLPEAPKE